jgi:hypothetical protein
LHGETRKQLQAAITEINEEAAELIYKKTNVQNTSQALHDHPSQALCLSVSLCVWVCFHLLSK